MATRPIFIPNGDRGALVRTLDVEIPWHSGFSDTQKKRNISELHDAAARVGFNNVLEVSTKSESILGRRLSAFSLQIQTSDGLKNLEATYQASKVFLISGQHSELSDLEPRLAKRGARELGRGEIVSFRFEGLEYPTEPKNAFYDWLYLRAVAPHVDWLRDHLIFDAYSDIEFNPKKSINCQGRAVALFHSLILRNTLVDYSNEFNSFRRLLIYSQRNDEMSGTTN